VLVLLYVGAVISLDYTANLGMVSVMCCLVGVFGLVLSLLLSQETYRLDKVGENGVIPCAMTFFGIYGFTLTYVGDITHYMNRDDPTWSYVNVGLSGLFVLISYAFTSSWAFNGCRCCSWCCGCCKNCCGTVDEDDEE
jgi:hypothetical protein